MVNRNSQSPHAVSLNDVLDKLSHVNQSGKGWSAKCPAHDDHHPSLVVTADPSGMILMHCHAGCSYADICSALKLSNIVACYDYKDEKNNLVYQVMRTQPKGFFLRRPDGDGGFLNDIGGVRRVLYRLPELLKADSTAPVFIPEGEKDVEALRTIGLVATCNSGGAGKWRADYNRYFAGRDVAVLPDNDEPGKDHGRTVATSLNGSVRTVKLFELPGLAEKGDVSDWLNAGGTKDELLKLLEETPILDSRYVTSMNRENIESRFTLIPLNELFDEEDDEDAYVWERTLPVGGFSICAAKPKVGKSTLARNLAVAVTRGDDFFGRPTRQGKVIYLALEEKLSEVKAHFRRMGATGNDIIVHKGTLPQNPIQVLSDAIKQFRPALVVIDPLSRFLRVTDFNSYGEVTRVLEPLIDVARNSGCHILTLHHNIKGDRDGGDSVLGSTAFFGAVDTLLLMGRKDKKRCLHSEQRYGENLPVTVAYLDPQTGRISSGGELEAVQVNAFRAKVLDAIGDESLTEPDIKERVGGNSTHTAKALRELIAEGLITRTGKGKKGHPYLYAKAEKSSIVDFPPSGNRESALLLGHDAEDEDDWLKTVNF